MDNITACAMEAKRLGISYGQLMATRQFKPAPIITPEELPAEKVRYCKTCGKLMRPEDWRKSYCSEDCHRVYQSQYSKEAARKKKGISENDILICPTCKKEFVRGDRHASIKYCSPECTYRARALKRSAKNN